MYFSDKASAEKLSMQVNDAIKLINDYNNRLLTEAELRKKVIGMLHDFLNVQKELLTQAEQTLEVGINFKFLSTTIQ